jgi:hypothetical protein
MRKRGIQNVVLKNDYTRIDLSSISPSIQLSSFIAHIDVSYNNLRTFITPIYAEK